MVDNRNIEIVYVPIETLKPSEYNSRKATEKECNDLKEGISEFGFVDPVVVNSAPHRKNIIIGGHFRLRTAKELGIKTAPVVYVNIPDIEKEKKLNLRLNKNTGSFDYDLLANNFSIEDLREVGFEDVEIDNIFDLNAMNPSEKKDESGDKKKTTICPECGEEIDI